MGPIKIMVNGIPGNMAVNVASLAERDNRFQVMPYALTGPEIQKDSHEVGSIEFHLIKPDQKEAMIRITVPVIPARVAPQKISPAMTSSTFSGVAIMAS